MNLEVDHSTADSTFLPRAKASGNQLRRVRSSKQLAFEANHKLSRPSQASRKSRNPSDLFSDYALEAQQTHIKQQHRVPLLPSLSKGYPIPESNGTSLVALIHGIFVGGGEPSTSQPQSNLAHQDNAFAFRSHVVHNSADDETTMLRLPRESRQEDGSTGSDGTSGASTESKTRSQVIPIQRSPPSNGAIDETGSIIDTAGRACKETYDWATWRMYNRIIVHREKYPVNASYLRSTSQSGRSPLFSSSNHVDAIGMPFDDLRAQLLRSEVAMMDGEIFHLEI